MREAANGARNKTVNGHNLTVTGTLPLLEHLVTHDMPGGAYTTATPIGPDPSRACRAPGPYRLHGFDRRSMVDLVSRGF